MVRYDRILAIHQRPYKLVWIAPGRGAGRPMAKVVWVRRRGVFFETQRTGAKAGILRGSSAHDRISRPHQAAG